jgi:hypothetical protein
LNSLAAARGWPFTARWSAQRLGGTDKKESFLMSAKAFVTVQKEFAAEAELHFGVLVHDFGFVGPERTDLIIQQISYFKPGVRCRVSLDPGIPVRCRY